ncbi:MULTISPECIES: hypothetical protein [Peribacillus]|uniref:Uncharacterized protein n=1 Tax=Peribacillus simplex TaxID=1478 RepID=A0A109MXA2_9BACI|nr:hypothetical protein [Peribacillus simplex]KWW17607.1 hypothetical protein AS888_21550 [Peribacillus simplex]
MLKHRDPGTMDARLPVEVKRNGLRTDNPELWAMECYLQILTKGNEKQGATLLLAVNTRLRETPQAVRGC